MKQFAIVKIGAIGDAVMAFPMAMRLKGKYPNSTISWIGGKTVRPLVEALGIVDSYIEVDERKLYHGSLLSKLSVLGRVVSKTFFKKFDTIFLLHPDERFRLLMCLSRGPLIHMKHGTHFHLDRYHAQSYMDIVDKGYPLYYPTLFRKKREGKRVALFPGGARNTMREQSLRRWPVDSYVKLAHLLEQDGYEVCILGGKTDEWILPHFSEFTCVVGEKTLLKLGQAIADADLFITHDTGPMHIAKLTKTKTFAIFGPVDPRGRMDANSIVTPIYAKKLSCQPCYDGRNFADCSNNLCMQQVTPQMVLDKVLEHEEASCLVSK